MSPGEVLAVQVVCWGSRAPGKGSGRSE